MEGVEAFLDGEWESLSKLFSCEDADVHLHFDGGDFSAIGVDVIPSHLQSVSRESSNIAESPDDYLHHHDHLTDNMDYTQNQSLMMPVFGDDLMEEILQLKAQMCNAEVDHQPAGAGNSCDEMQVKSLGKRPRVSRDVSTLISISVHLHP